MIEKYFGHKIGDGRFEPFALSHISMLLLLFALLLILFILRNRLNRGKQVIRYILIGFLLVSELSLYIWYNYTGVWDPIDSLPFQLCTLSLLLSIIMLFTRSYRLFEVTFFLGVGGAFQAMLTPELSYDYPHYRYFHFFLAHIAIIVASFYMILYEEFRPTLASVWRALITLNILALFVFFVNKITGGNYMFLARKPNNPSLIDYLGPYPWYLLSLEFVTLGVFLLLYLPFSLLPEKSPQKNMS